MTDETPQNWLEPPTDTPDYLTRYELRRIRLPQEIAPWQNIAWLESQATLWGELSDILDENHEGYVQYFAQEQANHAKTLIEGLAASNKAFAIPDRYLAVFHQLAMTTHKSVIPDIG